MKNIKAKLRSKRGETLAEILVSIAILGFSIGLMLTMVMTSIRINQNSRKSDEILMTELNAAEVQDDENMIRTAKIRITDTDSANSVEIEVNLYAGGTSLKPLMSYSTD